MKTFSHKRCAFAKLEVLNGETVVVIGRSPNFLKRFHH
jgi:hypothetical protein